MPPKRRRGPNAEGPAPRTGAARARAEKKRERFQEQYDALTQEQKDARMDRQRAARHGQLASDRRDQRLDLKARHDRRYVHGLHDPEPPAKRPRRSKSPSAAPEAEPDATPQPASHPVHEGLGEPFAFPFSGPAARRADSALRCTPLGAACIRPHNAIVQPDGALLSASQRLVAIAQRRISNSSIMRCRKLRVDAGPNAAFRAAHPPGTPLGGVLLRQCMGGSCINFGTSNLRTG
jgi:hypothetical protein